MSGEKTTLRRRSALVACGLLACFAFTALIAADTKLPNMLAFTDDTGVVRTFSTAGTIDLGNPFFQSLGTNGRSCGSCHQPSDAWTVTPAHIQARFVASQGLDPIFRTNDGSNCPSADVSTMAARQQAYSMLLNKGLIRVSIGVPAGATFSVVAINDAFNCPENTSAGLALFRRPLPAANLPFLTTVMWDGRESFAGKTLQFDLSDQANGATLGHAQAVPGSFTSQQISAIVSFELATFTTQSQDKGAGDLGGQGANGGPVPLSQQPFFVGINDPLGGPGTTFDPAAMTIFDAWGGVSNPDRAAIARGQALFNNLPIPISGVAGLNDLPGLSSFTGTCTTCHNTPNVGNHSVPLAINIGVTDFPAMPALDTSGLPVYTIQCATPPLGKSTSFQTTDPGRALITGNCKDVGKTKGPILRGLAARAPYFHNGSAKTLNDVVEFYEQRFGLHLTDQQKSDLVAFLNSL
jgi:cytochrome c peroxidase